ncbi:hypothetical protein [Pseudonocardia sp. H11422]|uniref:hypothetical protein n=1 Tax=Pseudonocardia sp. H11422 TaxID=2835866 RepID=UPI00292CBBD6|nr:hypothetical protein [Pseudonocardia sp. H11422]
MVIGIPALMLVPVLLAGLGLVCSGWRTEQRAQMVAEALAAGGVSRDEQGGAGRGAGAGR